jgi:hypothetical protein
MSAVARTRGTDITASATNRRGSALNEEMAGVFGPGDPPLPAECVAASDNPADASVEVGVDSDVTES